MDVHIDVGGADFEARVIEESRRRPVVVDFWAPWCGPCRVLGPVLERLASEGAGRWLLAKVNCDDSPELSDTFQIRGIPAVKAFRDGKVVASFEGARPEAEVRRWLEALVPGPAEDHARAAEALLAEGKAAEARAAFERALSHAPRHGAAHLGLARLELAEGRTSEAERHLDQIAAADQDRLVGEISALRLALRAGGGDLAALEREVEANAKAAEPRLKLGLLLTAAKRYPEALERLLEVVRLEHRKPLGEEARKAMLEIFDVVGPHSELAASFRSRLAAELYR